MQLVIATVIVQPEDAETAREALSELARASRGDDGCLSYEFLESTETPGTFRSIETWETGGHLDAHMGQPHVGTAVEQLTPKLTTELEIVVHEVSDSATM